YFFFQAEDGIRDFHVTGVQTCALPIHPRRIPPMAGYHGHGTQFLRGDGGDPEVFVAIGEVTDITGPEMERETIDVTSHDSPDGYREHIGGLKDGGEVSFEVNYDPDLHNILEGDFADSQPRNYKIQLPATPGGAWVFGGFITSMNLSFPM